MSKYIQIPNKIKEITGRAKLKEIYAYGLLRSMIKDDTYIVSYTKATLAGDGGWDERSSYNYLADLKKYGLITPAGKGEGKETGYLYNKYKLEKLTKDYSIYKPEFFSDPTLNSEQKGLLMLLRSYCYPGTRHMPFPSYETVGKSIGMDRDRLGRMIGELKTLKQVRIIDRTLIITNTNMPLAIDMRDYENWGYEIIYRFCLYKGVVPPIKNKKEHKDLGLIIAKYADPESLLKTLLIRFPKLPPSVSMAYFAQGLRGTHYTPQEIEQKLFIL